MIGFIDDVYGIAEDMGAMGADVMYASEQLADMMEDSAFRGRTPLTVRIMAHIVLAKRLGAPGSPTERLFQDEVADRIMEAYGNAAD